MIIAGLTSAQQKTLHIVLRDSDLAVQTFFRIKDTNSKVVPFVYNRAQRLVSQRSKGHRFTYVLKARKLGVSSRRFAMDIWMCATRPYQHRVLLTQSDESAESLFTEKIIPLLENCLIPLGGVVKRAQRMIEFPATKSRYYAATAGSITFKRGSDLTGYHFSEYAHWEKPDVVAGVEEALIDESDGMIETTANGPNFAKADWERAKRGENRYKAVFLPWTAHEAYALPGHDLGVIGEDEQRLLGSGMTVEQIAWRRSKRTNMRDPQLFPQEYPFTDDEAFLSSGRPVFDPLALLNARGKLSEAPLRGYLVEKQGRPEFTPHPQGELSVWRVPEYKHVYAVGADIAEGLEHGAYSAGEVLDLGDGEQVAEWHGHIAPDKFADILELLARWYHGAVVVPEAWPGPGGTTTSHLIRLKANVWRPVEGNGIGWQTTVRTKSPMVLELSAAVRDHRLTIRSSRLLGECQAYVYAPNGTMEPSLGNYSDCLMAMGIVWFCTRDAAARVDYYRAPTLSDIGRTINSSTSVPKFRGPRPGVRSQD